MRSRRPRYITRRQEEATQAAWICATFGAVATLAAVAFWVLARGLDHAVYSPEADEACRGAYTVAFVLTLGAVMLGVGVVVSLIERDA
jgi:hypothetical protein